MSVVIETTLGDFTVDLFVDERPQACKNFLKLCKTKYYNLCLFHSVQHNFIAQTGDPTGTGKSGESVFKKIHGEERKYFAAEMVPKIKHSRAGLISMVNCGNNMLGSQFFVTLSSELQSLDSEHCVFGELGEGHEILLKLNEVICDMEHRPYQDIRITHTVILEDPFDDPPGLEIPDQSPEPSKETLLNGRIAPDEELDEGAGLTAQELEERVRDREAQAQATILEIVGDLPDADMAPPENVLFICKLNPVTSDDDLEIIFSRFGKVKSCEVIRDKVTGDSLQYAFVEFEEQKSCEDAFFKMDNVLIDDRRIHVDFSQSVSKLRWKGKGRGVEHFDENSKNRAPASERQDNRDDRSRDTGRHAHREGNKHVSSRDDRYRKIDSENRSTDRREDRPREDRRERDRSRPEQTDRHVGRDRNRPEQTERHVGRDRSRQEETDRHVGRDRNRPEQTERHVGRDRSRQEETERHLGRDRSRPEETDRHVGRDRDSYNNGRETREKSRRDNTEEHDRRKTKGEMSSMTRHSENDVQTSRRSEFSTTKSNKFANSSEGRRDVKTETSGGRSEKRPHRANSASSSASDSISDVDSEVDNRKKHKKSSKKVKKSKKDKRQKKLQKNKKVKRAKTSESSSSSEDDSKRTSKLKKKC